MLFYRFPKKSLFPEIRSWRLFDNASGKAFNKFLVMIIKAYCTLSKNNFTKRNRNVIFVAPWCSGYHYCTTSFNKAWTQVLRRLKPCSRRVGDSRWWGSLTVAPAGNKAKRLSSVNHTTTTIHHHHHHCFTCR